MTSTLRAARPVPPRRLVAAAVVLLGLAPTLAACATDTPLEVVLDDRSVAPGASLSGTVVNADGDATVTIAPAGPEPDADGHRTRGEQPCGEDGGDRFTCRTDGLPEGGYVVQVTDAAQPSEGTATAPVAVTRVEDYDPGVAAVDDTVSPSEPARVRLTGWGRYRQVRVELARDADDTAAYEQTVRVGEDGSVVTEVDGLEPGRYLVRAGDGLSEVGLESDPPAWIQVTRS